MTKRRLLVGLALAGALAWPAAAEARVIDLRLSGNAGGMFGWGTTTSTPDMFRQAAGPGFGVEAGLKLLIFDFSIDVMQIINGDGLGATLIQGMFGVEVDIPVGHMKLRERPERAGRAHRRGGGGRAGHERARDAAGDERSARRQGLLVTAPGRATNTS